MKNLIDIIEGQNFLVNKKLVHRQDKYEFYPEDRTELKDIIIQLLRKGITDLNCIDVSKITDMGWLFHEVHKIIDVKDIDISEWDVSNVKNMINMFYTCEEFNADLSKWDVSNVITMAGMFSGCYEFNSDLSKWDVSHVKSTEEMFYYCKKFNSNITHWNISSCIWMHKMFYYCKSFNYDLSNWNIKHVLENNRIGMFENCETLIKNNKIPKWYK